MTIIGAGFDSPADNAAWAAEQNYGYELWTDDNKTLALTYGAAANASQAYPTRITVILDADGTLVLEYLEGVDVGTHPALVLDDCAALFGN